MQLFLLLSHCPRHGVARSRYYGKRIDSFCYARLAKKYQGGPPAARAIPPSVMAQRARPRMPVGFNLPDDQRGFPMPLYYNRPPNTAGNSVAQPNHGSTSSNNGNANPGQLTVSLFSTLISHYAPAIVKQHLVRLAFHGLTTKS